MDDWRIERLARTHDRTRFDCGKSPLDDFVRSLVNQYEKRDLGRTYVAVRPGDSRVLGYYTLASGAISFQKLPPRAVRKLPRHPVPAILLARLAVNRSAQGSGLGKALLVDALKRSLGLADRLGVHAVEVDAIDASAKAFYETFGFVPLVDNELHLYLPMATIKLAFGT